MKLQTQSQHVLRRSLSEPDDIRPLGNGRLEQVRLGRNLVVSRITLRPGWKWSVDVKPVAKTDLCEVSHTQYILTGRLVIEMDDGTQTELVAGDVAIVPPGHDAWVVGYEAVSIIDFAGEMVDYGRAT
jgi:mannose-6-phosphate isomerase-like protein (cupin superfamily)